MKVYDAATGQDAAHASRSYRLGARVGVPSRTAGAWPPPDKMPPFASGTRTRAKPIQVFRGHKSAVYGVAFSPDGKWLVSAGSNGNLKIWELATGRVAQNLTGQAGAVLSVAFSPDGRSLAYGGGDTTVRVWDVESGVERVTFRGHTAAVDGVQFMPHGERLVSTSAGQAAVKVWDLTRHPEYATLARTSPDIDALAFRDDGRRLVSVTVGGKLQTWDATSGMLQEERLLPLTEPVLAPGVSSAFSLDGGRLAARSAATADWCGYGT